MNKYLPHRVCLMMDGNLVALHVVANMMIAVAYVLIPVCIILASIRIAESDRAKQEVWKNRYLLAALFASFILACGGTHVLEVVVLFKAVYWLQGLWALLTGVISLTTAIVLLVFGFRDHGDGPTS